MAKGNTNMQSSVPHSYITNLFMKFAPICPLLSTHDNITIKEEEDNQSVPKSLQILHTSTHYIVHTIALINQLQRLSNKISSMRGTNTQAQTDYVARRLDPPHLPSFGFAMPILRPLGFFSVPRTEQLQQPNLYSWALCEWLIGWHKKKKAKLHNCTRNLKRHLRYLLYISCLKNQTWNVLLSLSLPK